MAVKVTGDPAWTVTIALARYFVNENTGNVLYRRNAGVCMNECGSTVA